MAKEEKSGKVNENPSQVENQENTDPKEAMMVEPEEAINAEKLPGETELLKNEITELKDKYLRLYSEFDNYKKRTSKEKVDLLKTANEDVLVAMLPILDDFERGIRSMKDTSEVNALKEGVYLIFNKLFRAVESKGLKPMEAIGKEFNSELHEAIAQVPAPSEEMKGKVVDEVEKGYYLNDKVIRFAKVVIGS